MSHCLSITHLIPTFIQCITKRNLHNNTNKNCICNLPAMVAERRRVPHELYPFSSANAFLTLA